MGYILRSINDLSVVEIRMLLQRAEQLLNAPPAPANSGPIAGLVFLEPSLRTRTGFHVAATRLGGNAVEAYHPGKVSHRDGISDLIRTVMGIADVVVTRPGIPLIGSAVPDHATPIINGGDAGPVGEHPSQALLDAFGWQHDGVDLASCSLAIVGDPNARSVRSLINLFTLLGPDLSRIRIVTTPELQQRWRSYGGAPLSLVSWQDLDELDLLYMAGLPHGSCSLDERELLRLTPERLMKLSPRTLITSPLPNIDEIDYKCYADPRFRAFTYSDWGVQVRMALIEYVLEQRDD